MQREFMMQLPPSILGSVKPVEELLVPTEYQYDLSLIANRLRTRIDENNIVLSPRLSIQGQPVIDDWLHHYEPNFLVFLIGLLFEQKPMLRSSYDEKETDAIARILLNHVREDLRRYALRRLAIRWSASRYPDSVRIGEPEPENSNEYYVPIVTAHDNQRIGNVVLTPSGSVFEEKTTTGKELKEALDRAV